MWDNFEVISRYTRTQAIEDGVLADVSETPREAGFRLPVALTSSVWAECVEWSDTETAVQDQSGRLWDVLWMAAQAARRNCSSGADRATFELLVVPRGGRRPQRKTLVLHVGPGDDAAPVITVMLPHED